MFQFKIEILSGDSPDSELSAFPKRASVQLPILLLSLFSFVEETNCSCSGTNVQAEMMKQRHMLNRADRKVLTDFIQPWNSVTMLELTKAYQKS
jgi:hypothetical protein